MAGTEGLLIHHWAMDEEAAGALAAQLSPREEDIIASYVADLSPDAVALRDQSRAEIGELFTGNSDKTLFVGGSCSDDQELDHEVVVDVLHAVHDAYNGDVIGAARINGAKPRSGGKPVEQGGDWTGEWHSTDPKVREHLFGNYRTTFEEGIPIFTEITGTSQIGALAPFLSGIWLGARDMPSSGLRAMASAFHLPVGVKNGTDGKVDTLQRALVNITRSSAENSDSGADLGTLASSPMSRGIPTGVLPVGAGNPQTAVIARGHDLPEKSLNAEERRSMALKHLSDLCLLSGEINRTVILDGSHDVPKMFDIERSNSTRFPEVMEKIFAAMAKGEIQQAQRIRGLMVEIGSGHGSTDPNWIMTPTSQKALIGIVGQLVGQPLPIS